MEIKLINKTFIRNVIFIENKNYIQFCNLTKNLFYLYKANKKIH